VGASIRGNFESSFFDSADWFAELFLCDQAQNNCDRRCTTQVVAGEDVTWNSCCDLGTVTSGQYARIDVWDDDFFTSDDFGGRVLIKLEPGGFVGRGNFELKVRGEYTEEGSSVDVSVAAAWSR